jgi:hypothetical protein
VQSIFLRRKNRFSTAALIDVRPIIDDNEDTKVSALGQIRSLSIWSHQDLSTLAAIVRKTLYALFLKLAFARAGKTEMPSKSGAGKLRGQHEIRKVCSL